MEIIELRAYGRKTDDQGQEGADEQDASATLVAATSTPLLSVETESETI